MTTLDYFIVSRDVIFSRKIFPYHIYIYNSNSDEYSPFLASNTPLINSKLLFLKNIIEKGAKIAILLSQKKTFMRTHNLTEEEIPSLGETFNKNEVQHNLKKEIAKKKIEVDQTPFANLLSTCMKEDNFLPLINQARQNIIILSAKINPTVSMAIKLAELLMNKDTQYNRIVALSFFIAKGCNIKDSSSIGDLVTASFLHHIGYTQIDSSLSILPFLKLSEGQKKDFRHHNGLSHHLIKKSNVNLTPRCIKIILQHHERYNGLGYPDQSIGSFIEPMALILGCASHMVEFSTGKITDKKRTLETVMKMVKNMNTELGLELSFGDYVYSSVKNLIDEQTQINETKAA